MKHIVIFFILFCFFILNIKGQNIDLKITASEDTICPGQSVQLNATAGAVFYSWRPADGLNNTDIHNPIAMPIKTTTYYLEAKFIGDSLNLVVNSDFELGNTGFKSDYISNCNTTLLLETQYCVIDNPHTVHGGFSACTDHTSGKGNMMVINGATKVNQKVWNEIIKVRKNTDYIFYTWIATVLGGNPAKLRFSINGNLLNTINAPSSSCTWKQFYTIWNSNNDTIADISIVNINTVAAANDFALDDIYFAPIINLKDSITLIVKKSPDIKIIYNNIIICKGDSVILTATSDMMNTSYKWNTGETTNSIKANPVSTTTYCVSGTNVNGCSDTASVIVTVNKNNFQLVVTPGSATICYGNSVSLTAGGAATYTWMPAAGLNTATGATVIASPATTTTYIVSGTDLNNCKGTAEVIVNVKPLQPPALSSNSPVCEGNLLQLSAISDQQSVTFNWTGPNGFNSDIQNPVVKNVSATGGGEYSAFIIKDNCISKPSSLDVIINPNPSDFLLSDTTICGFNNFEISPKKTYSSYIWQDGSTDYFLMIKGAGNYWLKVTDNNGCIGSDTMHVEQECIPELYIPNAFNPSNGGENQTFFPKALEGAIIKFSMDIFNRWGELLYHTDDINKGWDGTFNGMVCPFDVYVYVLHYKFVNEQNSYRKIGSLTLLR